METAVDRERWSALYRDAFPRVYRALVAALFDAATINQAIARMRKVVSGSA